VRNQRGGALIVVMMVGTVIAIGFAGFITSSVLVESRAVDSSLARTRAYWAEMGNFSYAMSRISRSKFCNSCAIALTNVADTALATTLQAYFDELGNYQTRTYPDESASYTITATVTAAADDTAGRAVNSGWLMGSTTVSSSTVVSGLNGHLPKMELRLCVGLANSGSHCGAVNHNNGGATTAYFSVDRLTNLGG
jgi:hypothetical protein